MSLGILAPIYLLERSAQYASETAKTTFRLKLSNWNSFCFFVFLLSNPTVLRVYSVFCVLLIVKVLCSGITPGILGIFCCSVPQTSNHDVWHQAMSAVNKVSTIYYTIRMALQLEFLNTYFSVIYILKISSFILKLVISIHINTSHRNVEGSGKTFYVLVGYQVKYTCLENLYNEKS